MTVENQRLTWSLVRTLKKKEIDNDGHSNF
jgi:hypothetical protein